MGAGDAALVADSWNAVRRAVGKTMPRGYAADMAVFAVSGVAHTLDAELARGLRGRAQQAYYLRQYLRQYLRNRRRFAAGRR